MLPKHPIAWRRLAVCTAAARVPADEFLAASITKRPDGTVWVEAGNTGVSFTAAEWESLERAIVLTARIPRCCGRAARA